jgi:flagellar hook assembly protein FlgD
MQNEEMILVTGLGSVDRYNVADLVGREITFSNTKRYKERKGMIVEADADANTLKVMVRISEGKKAYMVEEIKSENVLGVWDYVDLF